MHHCKDDEFCQNLVTLDFVCQDRRLFCPHQTVPSCSLKAAFTLGNQIACLSRVLVWPGFHIVCASSVCLMSLRFIHIVTYIRNTLFIAEYILSYGLTTVCFSADGHLGCFQFGANLSKCYDHSCTHLCMNVFISLG